MRKSALLVVFAAALLFIGTGCDTVVTLEKPTVSAAALGTDNGGTLRLTWTAVTDAKNYEITTDDSTYTVASTVYSFDVTTPSATVEVRAVNGSDKSDPATIDCKVVETPSIVLYGQSDPSSNDPSGLAFTTSGTASALSLDDANKASLDFVYDDVAITGGGLANAGDYTWPQNTKVNTLMDAGGTDYDAFVEAASTGYISQLAVSANGLYAFWLSNSTAWSTSDHFCKAKVVSIEQPSGTYYKVTLKVAYQKVGGLRWLK
jgi:hypothetical protein